MTNPSRLRGAFTLIELLTVIAIIAVLAALSITAIGSVMGKARATKCGNFMRQLGNAALLYAGDNEMTLPVTVHQRRQQVKPWTATLQEYANGKVTFRCPDDPDKKRGYTYVINDFLTPNPAGAPDLNFSRLPSLERPASTLLFGEASPRYKNTDHFHFTEYHGSRVPEEAFEEQVAVKAHGDGANYVSADGHMETLSWMRVQERLRTPGEKLSSHCWRIPMNPRLLFLLLTKLTAAQPAGAHSHYGTGNIYHLCLCPLGYRPTQRCGGYYMLDENARKLHPADSFSTVALSDGSYTGRAIPCTRTAALTCGWKS